MKAHLRLHHAAAAFALAAAVLPSSVRADAAIGGVDVVLQQPSGHAVVARGKTNSSGIFKFNKVAPGQYTLVLVKDSMTKQGAKPEEVRADVLGAKPLRGLYSERLLKGIPVTVGSNGDLSGQIYGTGISAATNAAAMKS